jgi:hypothetical protein
MENRRKNDCHAFDVYIEYRIKRCASLTLLVPLVEKELPTLPEQPSFLCSVL